MLINLCLIAPQKEGTVLVGKFSLGESNVFQLRTGSWQHL
jgi:hypothetical protein